ncbi:aminopeptidase [candidate division KSB1 bacterium]|nr:aminopeptidase [candidate division KSB1 bacterium]
MPSLRYALRSVFQDSLRLRQQERLLILCDSPMLELATQFFKVAETFSRYTSLHVLKGLPHANSEPHRSIVQLMQIQDVVLLVTSRSLSHTKARRNASKRGVRIISMPGISEEILCRTSNGHYKQIVHKSRKLADILTIGRAAKLTSPSGTDLSFSIARQPGHADTGMVHEPGLFSNLPAGEGCIGPVHGSAEGKIVVDGSFPGVGKIINPVEMRVKNGYVVRITGDSEAEQIRAQLKPFGRAARNIAEVGIGTNPNARFTGCTLEDEKVLGTVHVGLGNSLSFDGKVDVPCHLDAVLFKPTLIIDDRIIIENGEIQV